MDSEKEKQLKTVVVKLTQNISDLVAVLLFGTFGSEYETQQSDLDLALLARNPLDPVSLWKLTQEIAIDLNRDVDLIDLRQASTVFRYQILTTGQLIYCSDQNEFARFDTTSFSMYFDLQETRKEILKDYEDRNMKYG